MKNSKSLLKSVIAIAIAGLIIAGNIYLGTSAIVFAANETQSTIRMGNNAPMTHDEFMEWREQRGIRHINIEGRIYPAGIFFSGYNGKAFTYGALTDRELHVYLIPGGVSNDRTPTANTVPTVSSPVTETPNADAPVKVTNIETPVAETPSPATPVIFDNITPIFFSDDELTAMIENVPDEGPYDARSSITLPNRALTETELEAWINEYNELGGATAFELGVVREVNRVRERYGLPPLSLSPALMMSARLKTQEFGDLQYYSHRSPVHGSPSHAARMFGFEGGVGEAMTRAGSNGVPRLRSTPESVVAGMLASNRGHRELLLHPDLESVGFGAFFSPNSRGPNGNMSHMFYFVTKFGFS